MRKLLASRTNLLIVGIVAASVILLSQSFRFELSNVVNQDQATEQAENDEDEAVTFIAANDAVAHINALQLNPTMGQVQEKLQLPQCAITSPVACKDVGVKFFKILFRAIIASKAP
jgi:hypothetical protein